MNNLSADASAKVLEASKIVREGGLIVLPTDTVYGIGCDPFSARAVSRLLLAKGRNESMPPPVLAASVESALSLATWNQQFWSESSLGDHSKMEKAARILGEKFWPGGLTLIVPTGRDFGWSMHPLGHTVAVRVPDHPLAINLLKETGPLAVTSANLTGEAPATTVSQARKSFGNAVEYYLDGGTTEIGIASTIVDCTFDSPRCLRAGAIEWKEIERALG